MPKQNALTPWPPSNPGSLARQFSRLGWIGFWMQLVLVSIPVILILYVLFIGSPESAQRKGIDLSNYLSYGSLLVMLFTIYWFCRYTRLAKRIVEPEWCPPSGLSDANHLDWPGGGLSGYLVFNDADDECGVADVVYPHGHSANGDSDYRSGRGSAKTLSAIDAVSLTALLFILTAVNCTGFLSLAPLQGPGRRLRSLMSRTFD